MVSISPKLYAYSIWPLYCSTELFFVLERYTYNVSRTLFLPPVKSFSIVKKSPAYLGRGEQCTTKLKSNSFLNNFRFSSPIQTFTVGFGISPNPPCSLIKHGSRTKRLPSSPPVGNCTRPRRKSYSING